MAELTQRGDRYKYLTPQFPIRLREFELDRLRSLADLYGLASLADAVRFSSAVVAGLPVDLVTRTFLAVDDGKVLNARANLPEPNGSQPD